MKYYYKAKKDIQTVEGFVEAANYEEAVEKLEKTGCLPITIKAKTYVMPKIEFKLPGVSRNDIAMFTQQLYTLMKSKVPLVKAMEILHRQTQNKYLQHIILEILINIKAGKPLSETLTKYPRYFSGVYTNMIMAGERGGILDDVLLRLVIYADEEEEIRDKIRFALAYPIFMAAVGFMTIFFMLVFVMPKLVLTFAEMGQELPLATQVLIALSGFLNKYWYVIVILVAGLFLIIRRATTVNKHKVKIDRFLLSVPILKKYLTLREITRFCRTAGMLLGNGIPIRAAIEYTINTMDNSLIVEDMKSLEKDLSDGVSFSGSLEKTKYFPEFVISLLKVGEESGQLSQSLLDIAANYDRQFGREIKLISTLIEPFFILAIGSVVGFIVVAMLLPVFQMNFR